LEARPADLALDDAELMAECKNFDLKRGISLRGEDEEIEQGVDDRVEDTQNDGVGSCRAWRD
jgi:hypothetical protein